MNLRKPAIQVTGQADEALGIRRHRLQDRLVQADPNRELDEHRSQATQRVDSVVLVQAHRLLGCPLLVVFVLCLDLLHQRLKCAH